MVVPMNYKMVQALADEGKSLNKIAEALGVSRGVLYGMRKKDPKLNKILGGMRRNPNKPRVIDYKQVTYLAGLHCTEYEIATVIGFTQEGFSKRKKRDPQLRKALDEGYINGKVSLRRSQMRSALDRYLTICKDCQKIYDGEFMPSCVYCDAAEVDPKLRGPGGAHTNVKHKFIPGNITAQIWLGKQVLHQSDNVKAPEQSGTTQESPLLSYLKADTKKTFKDDIPVGPAQPQTEEDS